MGPVVNQVANAYAGRAEVRTYYLDQVPDQNSEAFHLLAGAQVHQTPTFLLFSADGQLKGKYEGRQNYYNLARRLDEVIAAR